MPEQLKVISFSLWGSNPKYTVGAIRNAEIALDLYPDWECHYHVASDVPDDILETLSSLPNTYLYIKSGPADWRGMFWRFETSYYPNIDISIFRDTDSRLSLREKAAVDEWLNTDKSFHIMRDHPYHGFPILGGMWGYRKNYLYDMKKLLNGFNKQDKYGTDYDFFSQVLYPIIGNDKVVHDPFFEKKPFPTKRVNRGFVGEVFDEYDIRHPQHYLYIPDNE
jgi:hypothetical protein